MTSGVIAAVVAPAAYVLIEICLLSHRKKVVNSDLIDCCARLHTSPAAVKRLPFSMPLNLLRLIYQ